MDNRRQLSQQGRRSIRHASTGLEAAHKSPAPHDAYNSSGLEGAHNSAAPHDAHSSPALEAAHNSAGRHDTIRDHQQYALEGRRSVFSLMEFYQKPHMGKVETLNKGIYIEEMLKDDSFYESHGTVRPLVANFKIRVPSDIGEQRPTSYAIYMT
ncbi:hypothetical protein RJT34_24621 [Clitoria ternatea]|uniref:Uncharacterized protein n=1 Tax=Clitoria ternatea TaxID=43366 RepID=A0AAN9FV32_CLITE